MAVLRIPDEKKTLREESEIRDYLAGIGIDYERWEMTDRAEADASVRWLVAVIYRHLLLHLHPQRTAPSMLSNTTRSESPAVCTTLPP